jgi:hypothetical protein
VAATHARPPGARADGRAFAVDVGLTPYDAFCEAREPFWRE